MFRMGGSANEGITSGLDTPRQGYKEPSWTVDYHTYMSKIVQDTVTTSTMDPKFRAAYQPYFERPEGEGLSRFLINFGLNLASTPPMGKGFSGLISTAAAKKNQLHNLFEDLDEKD